MSCRRLVFTLILSFFFSVVVNFSADAQKGTAPSGYFPMGYSGDTFSGAFVPSDDDKLVKLVYQKGSKTESFEGSIEAACQAPTQADPHVTKELHLSSIAAGTVLTVYYNPTTVKTDGKKVRTNLIWGIRFDVVNGQALTSPDRPIIACSHQQGSTFRAFN